MTRDEIAKAGLKRCDEVEELMSDGEIKDQALVPAARLEKLMDKLATLDSDPTKSQQIYESMTDMLFGFLYNRDLARAVRGLWIVRLALAEELTDAFRESYEIPTHGWCRLVPTRHHPRAGL